MLANFDAARPPAVMLMQAIKLFLFVCASVQAAVVPDHRSEQRVEVTKAAGYPFGSAFSDVDLIGNTQHRRIAVIRAAGCEPGGHLTSLAINFRDVRNAPKNELPAVHGKASTKQEWRDFRMDPDEFVQEVRVTTWDKKVKQFRATVYHTRIGSIRFTTNKKHVYECGSYDQWDSAWTWGGPGKALLYFSGSQGDAIDQLQGHFIPAADF